MKEREFHIALLQECPIRFQEYGVGIFSSIITKNGLKKAIKKGLITIDGELASTATFIKGEEKILLFEIENDKTKPLFQYKLKVYYEDEFLAIVCKPAGIIVSGNKLKTIANALAYNLKASSQKDALTIPQATHRLDFPTSGLLLIAKTNHSLIELNRMFANKQILKTYHAITIGVMQKSGQIALPIENKESVTGFEVLRTTISKKYECLNLVKLKPLTGRRHQLRIHLSKLGNPILGDVLYGKEGKILKGKGLYLHASELSFQHPILNTPVEIKEELPLKFLKIFKK